MVGKGENNLAINICWTSNRDYRIAFGGIDLQQLASSPQFFHKDSFSFPLPRRCALFWCHGLPYINGIVHSSWHIDIQTFSILFLFCYKFQLEIYYTESDDAIFFLLKQNVNNTLLFLKTFQFIFAHLSVKSYYAHLSSRTNIYRGPQHEWRRTAARRKRGKKTLTHFDYIWNAKQ